MIKKILSFLLIICFIPVVSYAAKSTVLAWNPNTESDLKGYKVFRGYINCEAQGPLQPLVTLGKVTTYTDNAVPDETTVACYRLLAFDESLNDSPLTDQVTKTFTITPTPGLVGKVTDLSSPSQTDTSVDIQLTEIDNGLGLSASYDIRYGTPTISWGSATSVLNGSCKSPLSGVTVGQLLKCNIPNLLSDTPYQLQVVSFRGTMNVDAVFGPISDVLSVRTKATVVVPPPPPLDTDGDGFPDSIDKCPTVPGVSPDGCPVIVPPPVPTVHIAQNIKVETDGVTATFSWTPGSCTKAYYLMRYGSRGNTKLVETTGNFILYTLPKLSNSQYFISSVCTDGSIYNSTLQFVIRQGSVEVKR